MIYLDNASTTEPYYYDKNTFNKCWGNSSTLYSMGQHSNNLLKKSRSFLSEIFNVEEDGIIFTSGATEANNWVLRNVIEQTLSAWELQVEKLKPHVILSAIEHPSVKNIIEYYKNKELIDVSYVEVDYKGHVDVDNLINLITPSTCLVSCMYVNNEIGSIQPIQEIGHVCNMFSIPFHVDATQAVGKLKIDIQKDQIDFLTFSGHKIHGPKGVGALICKNSDMLESLGPFIIGGHQQGGYRGGTENVIDIYTMSSVLKKHLTEHSYEDIQNKTQILFDRIKTQLFYYFDSKDFIINSYDDIIPVFNVSFRNISGEYLMTELDKKDIYISTGSACTSGNLDPSYVLKAINCPDDYIYGTIRISFDPYQNSEEDIIKLFRELKNIIKNN